MVLNIRKSGIQGFKKFTIRSWNKGVLADWIEAAQRAWQHSDASFNSKLGLSHMILLGQNIYGFEV